MNAFISRFMHRVLGYRAYRITLYDGSYTTVFTQGPVFLTEEGKFSPMNIQEVVL